MAFYFSIYTIGANGKEQDLITEANNRNQAIKSAEDYFMNIAHEQGEYGEGEIEAILIIGNSLNDHETFENIVLSWDAADDYDGGRFDYNNSRV